ncbi:MAG: hypothetical protein CR964_00720 [Rhodobacterales bacterium]|nr:MAG: hypothetical protein CR964_00720 [Rhodobacterales bacterium]
MTLDPDTLPLPLREMLDPGEKVLAHWRPVLSQFARESVLAGALTSLLLAPVLWGHPLWVWLAAIVLGALAWGVIFDDLATWRQRRNDHWVLSNQRLLFCNDLGDGDPTGVPLSEITGFAGSGWFGILILRLSIGTKLRMSFLASPPKVRAAIIAARDKTGDEI